MCVWVCVCYVYVTTVIGKKEAMNLGCSCCQHTQQIEGRHDKVHLPLQCLCLWWWILLWDASSIPFSTLISQNYLAILYWTPLFEESLKYPSLRATEMVCWECKKKSQAKLQYLFVSVWNIILIENVIFGLWIRRTIHEL